MKKEYLQPWVVPVLFAEPAQALCSSELEDLSESGDLSGLGWVTNAILTEP